jgi:adenylate cyclase
MKTSEETPVYAFEEFELDGQRRRLSRTGEPLDVPAKVLETLLYLVEHPGELVDKNDLMRAVWPNVVVEENNLNQAISTLRRVLGERPGENRFIATVPGRGYRFVANVRRRHRSLTSPYSPRALGRYALLGVIFLMVSFVLVRSLWPEGDAESEPSIVVLPFANLSGDTAEEYLANGIAEELLYRLAKVPGLRVIARTSAFSFRSSDATIGEIAEILNVDHVVEGSVRREADQIRIAAQLVDAESSVELWTETFERPMEDIFPVQEEIAAAIVDELGIRLKAPLPPVDETSDEIYGMYLKAQHINTTGLRDSLQMARELMEQAVTLDPSYFPVRNVLAQTYFNLGEVGQLDPDVRNYLVKSTVEEAAELWPNRTEIIGWRAFVALRLDRDYSAAAEYVERALERDPSDTGVLRVASNLALELNRPEMTVAVERYILDRDPICFDCYQRLTSAYLRSRRYEHVEIAYKAAQRLGMESAGLRAVYADSLLLRGEPSAALDEFQAIRGLRTEETRLRGSAMALYSLNRLEDFQSVLDEIQSLPTPNRILASIYAYIGDLDAAFNLLNHEPMMPLSWFDGPMSVMRDHPQWEVLARRAGAWPKDPRTTVQFEITLPD